MLRRASFVQSIQVNTLDSSGQLQIGDSQTIHSKTDAFAMVRDRELFFGKEGDLTQFTIFNKQTFIPPINETLFLRTENRSGKIQVNEIEITGIAASGIVHIGCSDKICLGTRIKHIRHITVPRKTTNKANH